MSFVNMYPQAGQYDEGRRLNPKMSPRMGISRAIKIEDDLIKDGRDRYEPTRELEKYKKLYKAAKDESEKVSRLYGTKVFDIDKKVDLAKLWMKIGEEAKTRDAAHQGRQEKLAEVAEAWEKAGDTERADLVKLAAQTEQKQYETIVWESVLSKEAINNGHLESNPRIAEYNAEISKARAAADAMGERLKLGTQLYQQRDNFDARQDSYRMMADYAHQIAGKGETQEEKRAGMVADFVESYRDYKVAQRERDLAKVSGNPERIAETQKVFEEKMAAGKAAKADLTTKEFRQVCNATKMAYDQPRLFADAAAAKLEAKKLLDERAARAAAGQKSRGDEIRDMIEAPANGPQLKETGRLATVDRIKKLQEATGLTDKDALAHHAKPENFRATMKYAADVHDRRDALKAEIGQDINKDILSAVSRDPQAFKAFMEEAKSASDEDKAKWRSPPKAEEVQLSPQAQQFTEAAKRLTSSQGQGQDTNAAERQAAARAQMAGFRVSSLDSLKSGKSSSVTPAAEKEGPQLSEQGQQIKDAAEANAARQAEEAQRRHVQG